MPPCSQGFALTTRQEHTDFQLGFRMKLCITYERFVLSYYQRHHPEYAPRSYIEWDLWNDETPLIANNENRHYSIKR